MSEIIIGIDLGTTNSEVAIVENGRPRVLKVDQDEILPSMVGLTEEGKLLVGKPARNQYVLAPERTIKSIKRKMGEDVLVTLGDQKYRPQEISAMILRRLKEAAEKDLGQPIEKAVITVPAYFNDTQRQATREAGELAGLQVVRILNEPTAAALTYSPNPTQTERFLVYDLGGGTFDVSIVQAENEIFEVLASHGDTQLGGDDFDELLLNFVAEEFLQMYQVDLRENRVSQARLLRAVEDAKKKLSDHANAKLEEEFIAEKDGVPLHLSMELNRSDYEALILPLLKRTMECVQKALDDAKLPVSKIDRIVLVGGSTRTPMIGTMLESKLNQIVHREVHPDLCVAMGAAIQAAIVAGQEVGAVLVDITPHTLGIRSLEIPESFTGHFNDHKFSPIIKRNTPLPTNRSEIFCTVSDYQANVDIEIFQGESQDIRRNHLVGKFLIEGLARVPSGNQIVVQMDLNLDGILKVSAREKATGLVKQITIENAIAKFAVEEKDAAQTRLDKLWQEPQWSEMETPDGSDAMTVGEVLDEWDEDDIEDELQDEMSEVFGQDDQTEWQTDSAEDESAEQAKPRFTLPPVEPKSTATPQESAQALIEKATRLRVNASPEDQTELDALTAKLQAALSASDLKTIQTHSADLANVLFYLEDA